MVDATRIDRDMRQQVRSNGKRPREAYNEMLTTVAKKFKCSEEQVRAKFAVGIVIILPVCVTPISHESNSSLLCT